MLQFSTLQFTINYTLETMIKSKENKGQRPSLGQRISAYMKEVRQESQGTEKKVNESIHAYFLSQSKKSGRPAHELLISIRLNNETLKAQLFHKAKFLHCLKTRELVDFFSYGLSLIPGVEKRVTHPVMEYLIHLGNENQINPEKLDVVIVNCSKLVVVEAYHEGHYLKHIPVKELIQHFRK